MNTKEDCKNKEKCKNLNCRNKKCVPAKKQTPNKNGQTDLFQ